jgi:hypothetical protein
LKAEEAKNGEVLTVAKARLEAAKMNAMLNLGVALAE